MEDQKRVRLIGINRKFDIIEAYSDWQAGKLDAIQVNCLNEDEANAFKEYAKQFLPGIPYTTSWVEKNGIR